MGKALMDLQLKFQVFGWSSIADNGFRHTPPHQKGSAWTTTVLYVTDSLIKKGGQIFVRCL